MKIVMMSNETKLNQSFFCLGASVWNGGNLAQGGKSCPVFHKVSYMHSPRGLC